MVLSHKLALNFDVAALRADLAALAGVDWAAHFNTGYYTGLWSGVVLRGPVERGVGLLVNGDEFEDTPLMRRCRYIPKVLAAITAPKRSVRLLQLDPGATIREHRDYDLGYDLGELRLHIPILTHPDVEFRVANRRIEMAGGELWYLDLSQPHRVANRGDRPRVHLVIDCRLNDWLASMIPFEPAKPAPPPVDPATSEAHLARFRALVRRYPELAYELMHIEDRQLFCEEVVRLAGEHDLRLDIGQVHDALASEQRRWRQSWMR